MKVSRFKYFLIGLNLVFSSITNAYCQTTLPETEISAMLKKFYTDYIEEMSKDFPDTNKLQILKKKFCTPRLLAKLQDRDLDYDPFLNAQDADKKWAENIKISKGFTDLQYNVLYYDSFMNRWVTIRLVVLRENNHYKIDSIIEE